MSTDPAGWPADAVALFEAAHELEVAAERPDGTLRTPTQIWVVTVDDRVYVRTWHRRDTGWFGAALASGRAQVQVPGLSADVTVEDVGAAAPGVDTAYRAKYGDSGAASMTTPEAASSTLRLIPR